MKKLFFIFLCNYLLLLCTESHTSNNDFIQAQEALNTLYIMCLHSKYKIKAYDSLLTLHTLLKDYFITTVKRFHNSSMQIGYSTNHEIIDDCFKIINQYHEISNAHSICINNTTTDQWKIKVKHIRENARTLNILSAIKLQHAFFQIKNYIKNLLSSDKSNRRFLPSATNLAYEWYKKIILFFDTINMQSHECINNSYYVFFGILKQIEQERYTLFCKEYEHIYNEIKTKHSTDVPLRTFSFSDLSEIDHHLPSTP